MSTGCWLLAAAGRCCCLADSSPVQAAAARTVVGLCSMNPTQLNAWPGVPFAVPSLPALAERRLGPSTNRSSRAGAGRHALRRIRGKAPAPSGTGAVRREATPPPLECGASRQQRPLGGGRLVPKADPLTGLRISRGLASRSPLETVWHSGRRAFDPGCNLRSGLGVTRLPHREIGW